MKNTYQQIEDIITFVVQHKLQKLSLEEIAKQAEVSPTHMQKLFSDWVGVSPKQFGRYLSLSYAKDLLKQGNTLEKTAMLTGLSGTGRLHDLFVDIEAMTPGEYKANGTGLSIAYDIFDSPFGRCLVATTHKGVCNVLFGDTDDQVRHDLQERWPEAQLEQKQKQMQRTVIDYIKGIKQTQKIKLHLQGTNFQLKVWEALLSVPEGQIASYGNIAKKIEKPGLSRAVGRAIGDNPIGYIIPCHRVLKSTGEISGYRWGVNRKRAILEYEALKTNHGRGVV